MPNWVIESKRFNGKLTYPNRFRNPKISTASPMIGCPVNTKKNPRAKIMVPLSLDLCFDRRAGKKEINIGKLFCSISIFQFKINESINRNN